MFINFIKDFFKIIDETLGKHAAFRNVLVSDVLLNMVDLGLFTNSFQNKKQQLMIIYSRIFFCFMLY